MVTSPAGVGDLVPPIWSPSVPSSWLSTRFKGIGFLARGRPPLLQQIVNHRSHPLISLVEKTSQVDRLFQVRSGLLQRLLEVSMLIDVFLLLPMCTQSPHTELVDYTEGVLVTVSEPPTD